MEPQAIELSNDRLRKAKRALLNYNEAKNFEEALDAWTDFLVSSAGIYSKFEQGCKANVKSQAWFNKKKHERRTDEMLQYLHQARNADEHGFTRLAANDLAQGFNKTLAFNERIPVKVQRYSNDLKTLTVIPMDAVVAGPSARLVEVTNRGQSYTPPSEHLGKPLPFGADYPDAVMKASISYLEQMINEAQALVD